MNNIIRHPFCAPPSDVSGETDADPKQASELEQLLEQVITPIVKKEFDLIVKENENFQKGKNALSRISTALSKLDTLDLCVKKNNDAVQKDHKALNGTLSTVSGEITKTQTAQSESKSEILTEIKGTKTSLDGTLSTISGEIATNQKELTKSQSDILSEIKGAKDSLNGTLSTISGEITKTQTALSESKSEILNKIEGAQTALTKSKSEILNKIEGAQTSLTKSKSEILNKIEGAQTSLTKSKSAISDELTATKTALNDTLSTVSGEITKTQTALTESKSEILNKIEGAQTALTESKSDIAEQISCVSDKMDRDRVYLKRLLRVCASSIEKRIDRSASSFYLNPAASSSENNDNPFAAPVRSLRDDLFKQISEDVESKLRSSQEETRKRIDQLSMLILFLLLLSGLSIAGIVALFLLTFR